MPTQPLVRQGETISNVMDGLKQLEEKFEAAKDTLIEFHLVEVCVE